MIINSDVIPDDPAKMVYLVVWDARVTIGVCTCVGRGVMLSYQYLYCSQRECLRFSVGGMGH
jgi:hypothetical protein